MQLDNINEVSNAIAVIKAEQRNIEGLERFKACNEIAIVQNANKIQEALKGIIYDKDLTAPHYYTGKKKNMILDLLIKESEDRIKEMVENVNRLTK